ncbi:hypothetical protein AAVH_42801, partial [Aphelenchoides avenae]
DGPRGWLRIDRQVPTGRWVEIFPDDHGFMPKVAWHEGCDGKLLGKANTFLKNEGIWRNLADRSRRPGGRTEESSTRQEGRPSPKVRVDVDELNRDHGNLIDVRTGAAVARALMYRKAAKIPEDDDGQAA